MKLPTKEERKRIAVLGRKYYYCGCISPQVASFTAAVLIFLMYFAVFIYLIVIGYWYLFATLIVGFVCFSLHAFATKYWSLSTARFFYFSWYALAFVFDIAILALIGVFIYFAVLPEKSPFLNEDNDDDDDEEDSIVAIVVTVGVLACFLIITTLCLKIMKRFWTFLREYASSAESQRFNAQNTAPCSQQSVPYSDGSTVNYIPESQGLVLLQMTDRSVGSQSTWPTTTSQNPLYPQAGAADLATNAKAYPTAPESTLAQPVYPLSVTSVPAPPSYLDTAFPISNVIAPRDIPSEKQIAPPPYEK